MSGFSSVEISGFSWDRSNCRSLGCAPNEHTLDQPRILSPPQPSGARHLRFPVEFRGFPELQWPVQSCVQEIRGISLVFREMWDTADLSLKPVAGPTTPYGCPTFAPAYVGRKRWAKPFDSLSSRTLPRLIAHQKHRYKSEPKASRRPSQSFTTNSRVCHGVLASSRVNSTPLAAYSA
jgi:hypothetical protein